MLNLGRKNYSKGTDVTAIIQECVQPGPGGDEVHINEECKPFVLNKLFLGPSFRLLEPHKYQYMKAVVVRYR